MNMNMREQPSLNTKTVEDQPWVQTMMSDGPMPTSAVQPLPPGFTAFARWHVIETGLWRGAAGTQNTRTDTQHARTRGEASETCIESIHCIRQ